MLTSPIDRVVNNIMFAATKGQLPGEDRLEVLPEYVADFVRGAAARIVALATSGEATAKTAAWRERTASMGELPQVLATARVHPQMQVPVPGAEIFDLEQLVAGGPVRAASGEMRGEQSADHLDVQRIVDSIPPVA